MTNGRGTKICLIKTWRGQHSRALRWRTVWRGINPPLPPSALPASLVRRNLTLTHRAQPGINVFLFPQKRGGENEREITRLDLFVCSFPSYRLKYHSPSLSFSFFLPFSLCRSRFARNGFIYFINSEFLDSGYFNYQTKAY